MRRPSFQFYPADWRNNANLRRCSWAARGVWIEVMGLLHDSDHYGVLRWTLKEIAQALGCPVALVKELAAKDVMKGCDIGVCDTLIYVPRSGRKDGEPVTLIETQAGPIWFSSRMVKDEYIRTVRGDGSRFDGAEDSLTRTPKPPIGASPKTTLKHPQGDGSTASPSSTGLPPTQITTSTTLPPKSDQAPTSSLSASEFDARCKTLADRLTKAEASRARSFKFSAADHRLRAWVTAGITDPQLREAYDMAVTQREADGDQAAVNTGFLDIFVAKLLNPKDADSAVTVKVKEWHETASGIEAKAVELGLTRRFDEPFPAFKARVFDEAGLEVAAA